MNRGNYAFLLAGQFLSAAGDNALLALLLGQLTFSHRSGLLTAADLGTWNALFTAALLAPYVLLAPLAGAFNDRFARTRGLQLGNLLKLAGTVVVLAASGNLHGQLAGYAIVGSGACLYSPAKYGILPEVVPASALVRANGTVEMSTLAAILGGTMGGAWLADHSSFATSIGAVLAFYASAFLLALAMRPTAAHPDQQLVAGVRAFAGHARMMLTTPRTARILLGTAIFWFCGAAVKMNLQPWGLGALGLETNTQVAGLGVGLTIGIVAGSGLAGRLFGTSDLTRARALGWALALTVLALPAASSLPLAITLLALVGVVGGLFLIPLNAALQAESDPAHLGRTVAAQNFVENTAMVAAGGAAWILLGAGLTPAGLFVPLAFMAFVAATFLTFQKSSRRFPMTLVRFLVRMLLRLLYVFRVENASALRARGPALLVPNHVSWLDWLFLGAVLDDDWKFVTSSVTANSHPLLRRVMTSSRTFPIDPLSPYSVRRMAEYLASGGRLVLFAEGRISVTGNLMKLFEGTGFLLHRVPVTVLPCRLRGAERLRGAGSLNLKSSGSWSRWFPRVTLHVGKARTAPSTAHLGSADARRHLADWLRDQLVEHSFAVEMTEGAQSVSSAILDAARMRPSAILLEDASRRSLTARSLCLRAGALARELARSLRHEQRVGLLLPNVLAAPVTIFATWQAGRVPAILNYTAGRDALGACVELSGLRTVLTSRAFLANPTVDGAAITAEITARGSRLLYLEDLAARVSICDKAAALCDWLRGRTHRTPDALKPAAVLFTSGSEQLPKAVVLTHRNLLANIRQVLAVTDLGDPDRVFNALPIFHSFGLTIGLLLPLVRGLYTFLYPSPLHYRVVPQLVYDRDCTVMLATNTFLNGYARQAHPYDFRSVRLLFAGAEKLQAATRETWSTVFGVRILEGYGATECSPCLAVNSPLAARAGTVGRFLPGISWRLAPVEGVTEGGRLWVKGPNIMAGYLNTEAQDVFRAARGWYDTGDIVSVDADGFVRILGRQKRFAKVSGEMVSLSAVESALGEILAAGGSRKLIAVATRPDAVRGEVLVAVTDDSRERLDRLNAGLRSRGFTSLSLPRTLLYVREMPLLGAGKINYRALSDVIGEVGGREKEDAAGAEEHAA